MSIELFKFVTGVDLIRHRSRDGNRRYVLQPGVSRSVMWPVVDRDPDRVAENTQRQRVRIETLLTLGVAEV